MANLMSGVATLPLRLVSTTTSLATAQPPRPTTDAPVKNAEVAGSSTEPQLSGTAGPHVVVVIAVVIVVVAVAAAICIVLRRVGGKASSKPIIHECPVAFVSPDGVKIAEPWARKEPHLPAAASTRSMCRTSSKVQQQPSTPSNSTRGAPQRARQGVGHRPRCRADTSSVHPASPTPSSPAPTSSAPAARDVARLHHLRQFSSVKPTATRSPTAAKRARRQLQADRRPSSAGAAAPKVNRRRLGETTGQGTHGARASSARSLRSSFAHITGYRSKSQTQLSSLHKSTSRRGRGSSSSRTSAARRSPVPASARRVYEVSAAKSFSAAAKHPSTPDYRN